jgi:hypothetical protein
MAALCGTDVTAALPQPVTVGALHVKLQELARAAVAQARVRDRRQQGKARSLQELIRIGQSRGMKNPAAWARHVYQARQAKGGTQ